VTTPPAEIVVPGRSNVLSKGVSASGFGKRIFCSLAISW
jgi:hypothetical protein